MTKRVGRPPVNLDWKLLNSILQYGATILDCSDICEISEDVIQKRIKKEYKMTFTEYRKKKMSKTRLKLRQKQTEMALAGNVALLIWLGKNMLGQSDKVEEHTGGKIEVKITKDDIKL